MSGVCSVSSFDRKVAEHAQEAGIGDGCNTGKGKSANQVSSELKPTLSKGALSLVKNAVKHVALEAVAEAAGVIGIGAAIAAPVLTAVKYLELWCHEAEGGAQIRKGHERDAIHLAVAFAASKALPPDYISKMRAEYEDVDGEHGGANKILSRAQRDDEHWAAFKKEAEGFARKGRAVAKEKHITSKEALVKRLASDKKLAAAYRDNIAFRHGVDSFVYESWQKSFYGK